MQALFLKKWRFLRQATAEQIIVTHAAAAKEIQGTTDGSIDTALTQLSNEVEVFHARDAACVSHRAATPTSQQGDKFAVYATTSALDVRGMNKKLGTGAGEGIECFRCDGERCEGLPAVHGNNPALTCTPAAKVEDQMLRANPFNELCEDVRLELPAAVKKGTGDDDVGGSRFKPSEGVVRGNTATNLHTSGISGQGCKSRFVVTRTQLDDVAASQAIFPVTGCVPFGAMKGDKVGFQAFTIVGQRASDNLLDLSMVQVDTRAEVGHGLIVQQIADIASQKGPGSSASRAFWRFPAR